MRKSRTIQSLVTLGAAFANLVACAQEAPTVAPPADLTLVSESPIVTNQPPPPIPPEPTFPVWPAPIPDDSLFQPIAEQSFDSDLPPGPPGQCISPEGPEGCWFVFDPLGNFVADTASDAPRSPPGILRIRYPSGLLPGASPGLFQGWSTPGEGFSKGYSAIRETGWIRVPTPFFEMQRAGVKFLGYVGVGPQQSDALPIQVLFFSQAPTGGITLPWPAADVNVIQQNTRDRKLVQNVLDGLVFTFGEWHHYEFLMVLNDVGKANGRLRMWMDGVLLMDHDDVEYRTPEHPGGFYGRRWDPVWGGAGGEPRALDEYLEIDHVDIRGVPIAGDTLPQPPTG